MDIRYPPGDHLHPIIPTKGSFLYETWTLSVYQHTENSIQPSVQSYCPNVFIFNIQLRYLKTTPQENDEVLEVSATKDNSEGRHLFSCLFWSSTLPHSPSPDHLYVLLATTTFHHSLLMVQNLKRFACPLTGLSLHVIQRFKKETQKSHGFLMTDVLCKNFPTKFWCCEVSTPWNHRKEMTYIPGKWSH